MAAKTSVKRRNKINQLLQRDGNKCWICKKKFKINTQKKNKQITLDHIIPLSKGGGNSLENLRLAHAICNVRRDTFPEEKIKNGSWKVEVEKRRLRKELRNKVNSAKMEMILKEKRIGRGSDLPTLLNWINWANQ